MARRSLTTVGAGDKKCSAGEKKTKARLSLCLLRLRQSHNLAPSSCPYTFTSSHFCLLLSVASARKKLSDRAPSPTRVSLLAQSSNWFHFSSVIILFLWLPWLFSLFKFTKVKNNNNPIRPRRWTALFSSRLVFREETWSIMRKAHRDDTGG